jgi:hypothetical protein
MSGDKCVYFNCNFTSHNTFHRFPADIESHKEWIINSGNIIVHNF